MTIDGFDFNPASLRPPAHERRVYLLFGSLVGVALPLLAAWIARRSTSWTSTAICLAILGAISLWFSYGLKYGP